MEKKYLAEERVMLIAEVLKNSGSVTIEELAQRFNVSKMTIRRDLEKCQRLGLGQRCHGGAILQDSFIPEVALEDRRHINIEGKQRIADACRDLVPENSVLYLDAGTTTDFVAERIKNIPGITVFTNDLYIAITLLSGSAQVYMLGGKLQKSSGSLLGEQMSRAIDGLRFDVAFTGCSAIDDSFDTFTPSVEKVEFRRSLARNAKKSYALADSSKFYCQSTFRINSLSEYTSLITDKVFTEYEQKILKEKGICTICVG